jgi:hypothetical protein
VPSVMHNGHEVKDRFIEVAASFLEAQKPRLAALQQHLRTLTAAYTSTAVMFGEHPDELPASNQFFNTLVKLLHVFLLFTVKFH